MLLSLEGILPWTLRCGVAPDSFRLRFFFFPLIVAFSRQVNMLQCLLLTKKKKKPKPQNQNVTFQCRISESFLSLFILHSGDSYRGFLPLALPFCCFVFDLYLFVCFHRLFKTWHPKELYGVKTREIYFWWFYWPRQKQTAKEKKLNRWFI